MSIEECTRNALSARIPCAFLVQSRVRGATSGLRESANFEVRLSNSACPPWYANRPALLSSLRLRRAFGCKAGIRLRNLTYTGDLLLHTVRESGPSVSVFSFGGQAALPTSRNVPAAFQLAEQVTLNHWLLVRHFDFHA
jgi:hypothetical protein